MRVLLSFLLPGGLLFLGTTILLRPGAAADWLPSAVGISSCVILGVGLLVGWRFSRSNAVLALFTLVLADRILAVAGAGDAESATVIRNAVAVFLPLNIALLSALRDRRVFGRTTLVHATLILLQAAVVGLVYLWGTPQLKAFFEHAIVDSAVLRHFALSQPALCAFAIALPLVVLCFLRGGDAARAGYFWTIVCALAALNSGRPGWTTTTYLAAGGLILVVGMIESSHRIAFRDDLTGLPGRRAMNDSVARLSGRYAVAMIDVDHFKRFNDRYGHDVGDHVLRLVGLKLARVGGKGRCFRYGGEEFAVLFAGTSAGDAAPHLQEIRRAISAERIAAATGRRGKNAKKISVTVSIGLAGSNTRTRGPHDVIKAADRALYKAKKAGRNRLVS
jgi:diguanylate cyclase (GGDEF)-like protein